MEISGKFKKWMKAYNYATEKQVVEVASEIESFSGMTLADLREYVSSLISTYGEGAIYGEHWHSYEEFSPEVSVWRSETDEEFDERITSLREEYARYVDAENRRTERVRIKQEMKTLQDKLNKL